MTALKPKDIPSFLKRRNTSYAVVLIYGPDGGAVRERSDILARHVVEDLKDPFNFLELGDVELKEEPSRLVDEAAALSFMGGERVVRVRGSSEPITSSLKLLLNALEAETFKPNALILVEAGELRKTAALRKLIEASKIAAALPCYEDNAVDLSSMVDEMIKEQDLTIQPEAKELLLASLGTDRGISRAEVEKLILYKGLKDQQRENNNITIEDVQSCLTDFIQDATAEIAMMVAGGRRADLSAALNRATQAGTAPIAILIFLQRQFARLYQAQSEISSGASPDIAMKKLKPPVFFAEQKAFRMQLTKWNMPKLERALDDLMKTEHLAKTTGAPQLEIVERTALRLSMMAK